MIKIDDKTFNAVLRKALKETYEEEYREFIKPVRRLYPKRSVIAAASIAILIIISLPVSAVYIRYKELYHNDYKQIIINDDDIHSDTLDTLEIGYIPDGWIRTRESESAARIIERIQKDDSYIIISKSVFDKDGVLAIDDSYGVPEIIFKNNRYYYLYTGDDYRLVLFIDDYQYIIHSYKVKKSELIKFVCNIK